MKSGALLALAALVVVTGTSAAQDKPKTDPYLITAAEIAATSNIRNASEAISRLRPKFLRDANKPRSTATSGDARGPVVYVDECKECGPELRNIPVAEVVEIKFVEPMKASALYGDDHQYGAIFVTTIRSQRKKP